MPLYEYRCPACDTRLEVLQRMGEGGEGLTCLSCDTRGLERELSTFAANSTSSGTSFANAAPSCGNSGFT